MRCSSFTYKILVATLKLQDVGPGEGVSSRLDHHLREAHRLGQQDRPVVHRRLDDQAVALPDDRPVRHDHGYGAGDPGAG